MEACRGAPAYACERLELALSRCWPSVGSVGLKSVILEEKEDERVQLSFFDSDTDDSTRALDPVLPSILSLPSGLSVVSESSWSA